jgi:hypothetical protein
VRVKEECLRGGFTSRCLASSWGIPCVPSFQSLELGSKLVSSDFGTCSEYYHHLSTRGPFIEVTSPSRPRLKSKLECSSLLIYSVVSRNLQCVRCSVACRADIRSRLFGVLIFLQLRDKARLDLNTSRVKDTSWKLLVIELYSLGFKINTRQTYQHINKRQTYQSF